jgi:hypothetical protein
MIGGLVQTFLRESFAGMIKALLILLLFVWGPTVLLAKLKSTRVSDGGGV